MINDVGVHLPAINLMGPLVFLAVDSRTAHRGARCPGGNTPKSFSNPFGKDLEGRHSAIQDEVRVPPASGNGSLVSGGTLR